MNSLHRRPAAALIKGGTALTEGIAPALCLVCGMPSRRPIALCAPCEGEIPLNRPACPRCALPMPLGREGEGEAGGGGHLQVLPAPSGEIPCGGHLQALPAPNGEMPCGGHLQALPAPSGEIPCGACQQDPPPLARTIAPRYFAHPVDRMVRALKYARDTRALPVLTELTAAPIASSLAAVIPAQAGIQPKPSAAALAGESGQSPAPAIPDALLPMPLHWRRRWQRGFNQAELLATALAAHSALAALALPVEPRLARRIRHTPAQSALDLRQRQANLAGCFRCPPSVAGLHLAIIDDVMTTGASARLLARALLDSGARRVDLWCCARTPEPGG